MKCSKQNGFVAFSRWKNSKEAAKMVEGLQMICVKIISNVGGARSSYIEAIQKAKQGDFEGARCV